MRFCLNRKPVLRFAGLAAVVAGTAAAGTQRKFRLFIETSHQHVVKIVRGLTGYEPPVADTPRRNYGFFEEPKPDPLSHK